MVQATANPITTYSDDEALTWLLAQPSTVRTTVSALARDWGWNRMRTLRRLRRWSQEGHITHSKTGDGRSLIVVNPVHPMADDTIDAVFTPVHPRHPGLFTMFGAAIMAGLAVAISWYGLRINAWYGGTLGKTAEASALFVGLSVVADLAALALPMTASVLWVAGRRVGSAVAWAVWVLTMTIALLAAVGFASVNIADTTAERGKVAQQRAELSKMIISLGDERAKIVEGRPVATIKAEMQAAQGSAAPVWSATAGCSDVTRSRSSELCAPVQRLRGALGLAERRDEIEAALAAAGAALGRLPAVAIADAQAEMAAKLLRWLFRVDVSLITVDMLRLLGMTLLPQIGGLLLMFAGALWGAWRER